MRFLNKLIFILIITFSTTTINAQVDLSFLEGTWKIEGKDVYEKWVLLENGNLEGESFSMENGFKEVSEKLKINIDGNNAVYTATVFNQNKGKGIDFNLVKTADSIYSFQNLNHDFPQKINYHYGKTDRLFVEVLGNNNKGYSFFMKWGPYPYAVPEWFNTLNANSIGYWVADNSKYKSEQETYDAYGIEWKWGIGKSSIIGRLFGMSDRKEVGDFWQFRQYWDNEKQEAIISQFGYGAALGIGPISPTDDSGGFESIQTFSNADGNVRLEKHVTQLEGDKQRTTSWTQNAKGEWEEGRTYNWYKLNRVKPGVLKKSE